MILRSNQNQNRSRSSGQVPRKHTVASSTIQMRTLDDGFFKKSVSVDRSLKEFFNTDLLNLPGYFRIHGVLYYYRKNIKLDIIEITLAVLQGE